jgi:hypothetical protein
MKNWTWLLPCWVWKYFFEQFPRERVLVNGRTRFLIRLDEEFALVYDPQGNATLARSFPSDKPSRSRVSEFSYLRKVEPCAQVDMEK